MILIQRLQAGYSWLTGKANMLEPFALLVARLAVARVFFMSGLTKWNGFLSFNPDKYDLFLFEFFCPEEKRAGALVLCSDQAAGTYAPTTQWIVERFANMAGVMEILLPILLVLGLTSRLAAAGLLTMTLVIERLVFPDAGSWWGSHVWWATILFVIVARGPGQFSLDRFFKLESQKA